MAHLVLCSRSMLSAALAFFAALLLIGAVLPNSRGTTQLNATAFTSAPSPNAWQSQAVQPWCALPNSPVSADAIINSTDNAGPGFPTTPFPASFWFVKTIKTGSSTLTSVFHNICSNYGVQWLHTDWARLKVRVQFTDATQMHYVMEQLANLTDIGYMAITNHMWYSPPVANAFKPKYLFSTTRHPLGRVHSHYVQNACVVAAELLGWNNRADHRVPQDIGPNACDTDPEFLKFALQNDTVEARWTFANTSPGKNQVYHYIRGDKNTVEEAAAQYDFLFTAERMNEGLVMFMLKYGLTFEDIAYLPLKVRKGLYKTAADMPPEVNDFIMANNKKDLQLWNIANARLDKERALIHKQCGPGLIDKTLEAFEQLLDEVQEECQEYEEWYRSYGFGPPYTYTGLANTAFDSGNGFRCVKHVARRFMVVGPAAQSDTISKLVQSAREQGDTACEDGPITSMRVPRLVWLAALQFLVLLAAYFCVSESVACVRQLISAL